MPQNLARSLPVAERKTLAGEDGSQDSHDKLLFLIQEHRIGVTTNSPTLNTKVDLVSAPASNPVATRRKPSSPQSQHLRNASDASANILYFNTNICANRNTHSNIDFTAVSATSSRTNNIIRSTAPSSTKAQTRVAQRPPAPCDACPSNPDIRDDDISGSIPFAASLKTQTKAMSSQSLTQLNEGRSYDQYSRDGSQPSSPPGILAEEHRTLQEGDTGYVSFKDSFDIPDTAPVEPVTPFPQNNENDDPHDQSRFPSQPSTARANPFAPETPAVFPRPFISGDGQLMAASQLFGQTQPTSGLKKFSPTSSRPSPNIFGNNVTSPTHPTSSPLKNRGFGSTPIAPYMSTPGFPEHSSRPLESRTSRSPSPVGAPGTAEERDQGDVDKSPLPKPGSRRVRIGREPINEYRPYRKPSLDSERTRSSSQHSADSDFEREEAELRRRRARLHKAKASKSFPEISVPLPSTGRASVEVPSTNRSRRTKGIPETISEECIPQHDEDIVADMGASQETVVDSQDIIVQQKPPSGSDTPTLPATDANKPICDEPGRPSSAPTEIIDREMIPETSPACTFTEPPKLIGDIMKESSSAPSGLLPSSYPTLPKGAFVAPSCSPNKLSQSERNPSVTSVIDKRGRDSSAAASSPPIVPATSQRNTGRRSRRLGKPKTPSSTASESLLPSDPGTTSSTLTVLSATPVISSSLTPNTEDDVEPLESITAVSSPAEDRGQRRGRPSSSLPDVTPSLARMKPGDSSRQSSRKGKGRFSRHSSLSLDELDKPSTGSTQDSRAVARKAPRKSTTLREFQTKYGLFEGMVFAISFQDRQHSQRSKDKSVSKNRIEEMIRQEGGKILDDGFNTLFEFDTLTVSVKAPHPTILSSSLKLVNNGTGFAALIADGHSRKVKYMQALALGIPCLAPKWVTTCVSKKEVVDWSSYLLCAGSSTLLGDAIRSRNLQPYDASTAKLAQVISQRPRLLGESKILLIMKKAKNEEKRLPYVFLAQVLGASLVRVQSVEEARAKLRGCESGDEAFDWVYVDDHLQDARNALFGSGCSETGSKKRKRMSADTDVNKDRPPKRIRTLNDELVIQSLILGRLVEEDEMED
ncbi:hypothetical protein F5B22DRAFT_642514 [Xylaria bambusicola]|uniref:uncharacterized protein n=1 Tax=Xylaria bambusicola TaxID=326684 RepID=UPI002007EB60|nr:uncharacterized protein F5B22DRAFT_642514 [Xylaria bambusicola]KAI0525500.1 hypothetical protein F5B22DRAFT_642514 [Xylaria bambusicola]